MARLASIASGNLTDASTWGLIDSTSFLNSEAVNMAVTTSYLATSAFTPGAITVDGIAIKIAFRTASPTGTVSVELFNSTAGSSVAGTEVTINASDIPAATNAYLDGGWIFFKFSSPVTLLAATNYTCRVKSSNISQIQIWRDATSNNFSRFLRTTTTQAPAAGDDLYIQGERTGAGTGNSFTVTMNSTTNTDYGSAATSQTSPAISISLGGTLTYGNSASTDYVLRVSGHVTVQLGGTLNIGTVGGEIPRNSTAVLEFDCASDGDFGLYIQGGTFNAQGLSRTSGKNVTWCLLNTDEAAAQTTLGVDTDTGWLSGDEIAIAPTTRTWTEHEKRTLSGDAGASSMVVSSGLTNAHSGTSPTQAEVVLLTRNVKVRSVSSTAMSFMAWASSFTIDCDWVQFYYMGASSATGKQGLCNYQSGLGQSLDIRYCSLHDFDQGGFQYTTGTPTTFNYLYNTHYNLGATSSASNPTNFQIGSTHAGTIDNNVFIALNNDNTSFTSNMSINDADCYFTNNRIGGADCGGNAGYPCLYFNEDSVTFNRIEGNVVHSGTRNGIYLRHTSNYIIKTTKVWRMGNIGLVPLSGSTNRGLWLFDGCDFFGNTTSNIDVANYTGRLIMRNCNVYSEASFSTANGISSVSQSMSIELYDCVFGSPGTHSTADIATGSGSTNFKKLEITTVNTTLASTTEVSNFNATSSAINSFIKKQKPDGSLTGTTSIFLMGTITVETTNRHTASGYAWNLDPSSAAIKLVYPGPTPFDTLKVAVAASSQVTISIWVLKNAAYNGNAARLVLVGGIVSGIDNDVIDTAAATQKTITGATNASPIVITSNSHGYANGDRVLIEGVGGNTAANGMFTVANQTANTFELAGSTGNGAYTSGGTANVYEQLTVQGTPSDAGVLEFYVDCDGTAGNIYIDDVSVSQ